MNSKALKDKIKFLSANNNIDPQALMQNFFLERILDRIAQSVYKEKIILKGGLLIASIIGISNRSTMDLDATIKNYPMNIEEIAKLVKEIINIDIGDTIEFDFISIINIREDDEYNGYRVKIDAKFERIVQHLKLDFSTGDYITPRDINYPYKALLSDEIIYIQAYNIETIIAEKYETILSRGEANTRMRDFYDLYILKTLKSEDVDFKILRKATINTAAHRNSNNLLSLSSEIIKRLEKSDELKIFWDSYSKVYTYANKIKYSDTIDAIKWFDKKLKIEEE